MYCIIIPRLASSMFNILEKTSRSKRHRLASATSCEQRYSFRSSMIFFTWIELCKTCYTKIKDFKIEIMPKARTRYLTGLMPPPTPQTLSRRTWNNFMESQELEYEMNNHMYQNLTEAKKTTKKASLRWWVDLPGHVSCLAECLLCRELS